MKSLVVKRSIVLAGHKTSVSLEEPFWQGLKDIASKRRQSLSELVGSIDTERKFGNLSSAVRLFVLSHYQERLTSERAARPSDDSPVPVSH
jgi:predicted DNA-binding ribbon-helix-helix protein